LSKEPATIRIGDVVRASTADFPTRECFDASTNACTLTPDCRLKHLFDAALRGYFQAPHGAALAGLTSGHPRPESLPYGPPVYGKRAVAVSMPPFTPTRRQAEAPLGFADNHEELTMTITFPGH
jgi:Rrf2 family nitric oxide-sensitive transcriptional repressor